MRNTRRQHWEIKNTKSVYMWFENWIMRVMDRFVLGGTRTRPLPGIIFMLFLLLAVSRISVFIFKCMRTLEFQMTIRIAQRTTHTIPATDWVRHIRWPNSIQASGITSNEHSLKMCHPASHRVENDTNETCFHFESGVLWSSTASTAVGKNVLFRYHNDEDLFDRNVEKKFRLGNFNGPFDSVR